jgi:glutamine phosphoribosylpyrophosphate amidotransferase
MKPENKMIVYKDGLYTKTKNRRTIIFTREDGLMIALVRLKNQDDPAEIKTCRNIIIDDKIVRTEVNMTREGAVILMEALANYLKIYNEDGTINIE